MSSTLESTSTRRSGSGLGSGESPVVVERTVKALLNELTVEGFDSISDQIIAWVNKSEKERDGQTLIQVIKLVFEKATDEETSSEIYARLCRKMMEQINPKVQDYVIKNSEGKPIASGNLFRKYLLNRCQEDFERGWVAAAATEVQAVKEGGEESELYPDEYSAAVKARRRGLGLVRFIGELFKLQMLTERIMHECIKKLLANAENPEEEEIESVCKLLTTVGSLLDIPKARAHLDVYFSRMRELTKNKNVNARMVSVLQDVIELRERKWIPCDAAATPTTTAQVHEPAAEEKPAQEKVAVMRQNASMSRGGTRRGESRDSPMSRTATSSNMFSMLQSSDATVEPPTPNKSVGETSRVSTRAVSEAGSYDEAAGEGGTPAPAAISEGEAKSKIDEDVKEFFGIRMLDEAESYFSSLPTEHRHRLVDTLVMKSIEMKDPDVELVGDLFVRVREKDLCSPAVFEEGFNGLAELLDDLVVDIPKAWSYFAIMLKGSGLDQDEERFARIAEKTLDPDRLNQVL